MFGPAIITRSISAARIADQFGNEWQYHSRSDRHSKVTCWAIMFDLMLHCALLRDQVERGAVGCGINCELRDFRTSRKKNLDLVVCSVGSGAVRAKRNRTFADMAKQFGVQLSSEEQSRLAELPALTEVPVGSIYIALEAKAAMTEHGKALPRLHDELDSSHLTVHGHADHSIASALVMVNTAEKFASSDMNKMDLRANPRSYKEASQPRAAESTTAKVRQVRRRSVPGDAGFDAVGIIVVDFQNDGGPCHLVTESPAPTYGDPDHYDQMIYRMSALYQTKFRGI